MLLRSAYGARETLLAISLLLSLFLIIVGAQTAPNLKFSWHRDYGFEDMMMRASIIIVGEVTSLEFVGPVVHGTDDHGNQGDWQLLKVGTTVENTLKGKLTEGSVDFYVYMWLGGTTGDWNALRAGDRYVHFLERDQSVLRAIRDFERSSIEVGTGQHDVDTGTSPNEQVARILLTPGRDFQPARFRRLLSRGTAVSNVLVGPCKTLALLKALSAYPNEAIANDVKERIEGYLADDDPCPMNH